MALIELAGIERVFQLGDSAVHALAQLDLAIDAGEYVAVMGPSGSGKSTLLNLLGLLDRPNAGVYRLEGRDVTTLSPEEQARVRSRRIGFVFQSFHLVPRLTAAENIALPMTLAGIPPKERAERVSRALTDFGLENRADHRPDQLSGGQRQRVAIARALVTHPTVLLLDEPLAALDAKLREEMQIELINMQKEVGITFIYVTHDQTEALALSHRIAVMNKGRVEQIDEPDRLYGFPKTRFVADFIGTCNLLVGPVTSAADGRATITVPDLGPVQVATPNPPAPGSEGAVALRPEKVRITVPDGARSADNHFAGVVTGFLYQGDVTVYMVRSTAGHSIEALLANSGAGLAKFFEVGDAVEISWSADAGHYVV